MRSSARRKCVHQRQRCLLPQVFPLRSERHFDVERMAVPIRSIHFRNNPLHVIRNPPFDNDPHIGFSFTMAVTQRFKNPIMPSPPLAVVIRFSEFLLYNHIKEVIHMGTFSERLCASMDSANMKAVELHERTGISKALYRD